MLLDASTPVSAIQAKQKAYIDQRCRGLEVAARFEAGKLWTEFRQRTRAEALSGTTTIPRR
jgi:hypothetical protein